MDLNAARGARHSGAYDRALSLYRCVPAHDRAVAQRESYVCLLELTTSRRVIGDLMNELGWEPNRYRGFAHLEAGALQRANTAGLRDAFVALHVATERHALAGASVVDDFSPLDEKAKQRAMASIADNLADGSSDAAFRELARVSIADEMTDACDSADQVLEELEDLGIPISGGVRLGLARADMRAGRWHAALELLTALIAEAPLQVAGWSDLTVALLKQGRASDALAYAYFATQLRRNRPNLYEAPGAMLRYSGYMIVCHAGLFSAYRIEPDVNPTDGNRDVDEAKSSVRKSWHGVRLVVRGLALGSILRWALSLFLKKRPEFPQSDDLLELTAMIRSGG